MSEAEPTTAQAPKSLVFETADEAIVYIEKLVGEFTVLTHPRERDIMHKHVRRIFSAHQKEGRPLTEEQVWMRWSTTYSPLFFNGFV